MAEKLILPAPLFYLLSAPPDKSPQMTFLQYKLSLNACHKFRRAQRARRNEVLRTCCLIDCWVLFSRQGVCFILSGKRYEEKLTRSFLALVFGGPDSSWRAQRKSRITSVGLIRIFLIWVSDFQTYLQFWVLVLLTTSWPRRSATFLPNTVLGFPPQSVPRVH